MSRVTRPTIEGVGVVARGWRRRRHRRSTGLAAATFGLALLTSLSACGGSAHPAVSSDTTAAVAPATTPNRPGAAVVPVRPGDLPTAAGIVRPTTLRIAKIAVAATVEAVGIDTRTGDFAVPPSVDVIGWYQFGPGLEAGTGSVVIAGHVDSAAQGRGAFFRLRELSTGDRVEVTGADGVPRDYRVAAREEWAKSAIPLAQYFDRDGPRRLTLITCGGPFDPTTRGYRDNIVITAVPARP